MSHTNMSILALDFKNADLVKRFSAIAMAGLLLVACASKPKPIASTDAYSVQSVSVSSTASDTAFKSALTNALSGQFSGKGVGLDSELNITITNVRFGGSFTSAFYGAVNGATMNVVVRSTKTGLKLRDFKFSVTSNASDKERARSQMAENALRELKSIFKSRVKPEVVAQERKNAIAKRKAKPISLDPIGDLERQALEEPEVITPVAPEKPKLIPIAEASPEPESKTKVEIIKPETPAVDVKAPETTPALETPKAEAPKAEVAASPEPEAAPAVEQSPANEDEVLCVVTLENDCSE